MNKDILSLIALYLNNEDVINYSLINRQFNRSISKEFMESIGYQLCMSHYNSCYENVKQETFIETYKICISLSRWLTKLRIDIPIDRICYSDKFKLCFVMRIIIIPIAICRLTNLRQLDLSYNSISKIPDDIKNLVNLKWLNLSHNNLTEIPVGLCELINLERLYLSHNKISLVPKEISNLHNLREMDLTSNDIGILPIEICQMDKLITLRLRKNRIKQFSGKLRKLPIKI